MSNRQASNGMPRTFRIGPSRIRCIALFSTYRKSNSIDRWRVWKVARRRIDRNGAKSRWSDGSSSSGKARLESNHTGRRDQQSHSNREFHLENRGMAYENLCYVDLSTTWSKILAEKKKVCGLQKSRFCLLLEVELCLVR